MEAPRGESAGAEKEYSVRPLGPGDVAAAVALAASAPEAPRWSRNDYERAARGEFDAWVAASVEGLIGFVVGRRLADEMEILNLAVEQAHRRRGVASRLLQTALGFGRARGAKRVCLEVRQSNAAAIAFYRRQGFVATGRRPRYYSDPPEDALVLSRELDGGSV